MSCSSSQLWKESVFRKSQSISTTNSHISSGGGGGGSSSSSSSSSSTLHIRALSVNKTKLGKLKLNSHTATGARSVPIPIPTIPTIPNLSKTISSHNSKTLSTKSTLSSSSTKTTTTTLKKTTGITASYPHPSSSSSSYPPSLRKNAAELKPQSIATPTKQKMAVGLLGNPIEQSSSNPTTYDFGVEEEFLERGRRKVAKFGKTSSISKSPPTSSKFTSSKLIKIPSVTVKTFSESSLHYEKFSNLAEPIAEFKYYNGTKDTHMKETTTPPVSSTTNSSTSTKKNIRKNPNDYPSLEELVLGIREEKSSGEAEEVEVEKVTSENEVKPKTESTTSSVQDDPTNPQIINIPSNSLLSRLVQSRMDTMENTSNFTPQSYHSSFLSGVTSYPESLSLSPPTPSTSSSSISESKKAVQKRTILTPLQILDMLESNDYDDDLLEAVYKTSTNPNGKFWMETTNESSLDSTSITTRLEAFFLYNERWREFLKNKLQHGNRKIREKDTKRIWCVDDHDGGEYGLNLDSISASSSITSGCEDDFTTLIINDYSNNNSTSNLSSSSTKEVSLLPLWLRKRLLEENKVTSPWCQLTEQRRERRSAMVLTTYLILV